MNFEKLKRRHSQLGQEQQPYCHIYQGAFESRCNSVQPIKRAQSMFDDSFYRSFTKINKGMEAQRVSITKFLKQRNKLSEVPDQIQQVPQLKITKTKVQTLINSPRHYESDMTAAFTAVRKEKSEKNRKYLSNFPKNYSNATTDEQNQLSKMYLQYKENLRKELEQFKDSDKNANKVDAVPQLEEKEIYQFLKIQRDQPDYMIQATKKLPIERTKEDLFFMSMYIRKYVKFFQEYDNSTISMLCKQISSVQFEADEVIMREGEQANCMYIVIQGEVGVYFDHKLIKPVSVLGICKIFGENALHNQNTRTAWVKAHTQCLCLILTKTQFQREIFYKKNISRQNRLQTLITHKFCDNWTIERITDFNKMLNETKYCQSDVVYDVGQPSNVIYFLIRGSVILESVIDLQYKTRFPTAQSVWEEKNKTVSVDYEVKKLFTGDIFGHQELIETELQKIYQLENPNLPRLPPITRKYRVKCAEDCELYYINAQSFLEINFFSKQDLLDIQEKFFYYKSDQIQARIKNMLSLQNKTNSSIKLACNYVVQSQTGYSDFCVEQRNQKQRKLIAWLRKSKMNAFKPSDLPKQNGLEKIRVTGATSKRKIIQRDSQGIIQKREIN